MQYIPNYKSQNETKPKRLIFNLILEKLLSIV
jgi:hypothetical protein